LKSATQSSDTGLSSGMKDEPRFALNALGEFVFYNSAFASLAGLPMQAERARVNAAKVIKLSASSAHPAIEGPARRFMDQIGSGIYTLSCGPDDTEARFQFDWVEGPGGQRYLVASTASAAIPDPASVIRQIADPKQDSDPFAASAQLRAEELRQFLEMSDDLMCTTDSDGGILRLNRALCGHLGYEPRLMIGKMFIDFVDPLDRSSVQAALSDVCNEQSSGSPVSFECRMLTATGDLRWVTWDLSLSAGVLHCLGQDVTHIKTHEAELSSREAQLSEAQALAHMGHWRWEVGSSDVNGRLSSTISSAWTRMNLFRAWIPSAHSCIAAILVVCIRRSSARSSSRTITTWISASAAPMASRA